jgi:multidrug efflux pump subunit AcrA (membrane-fusion protein)
VNARQLGLFGPGCTILGALYFKPDLIREHARPVRAVFKFVVPIVLLAASLAGAGYLRSTRPAVQPAPAIERVWTVRAELARFADHRPVLQLFGDLVAGREVTLRPLVAGEVIEASPALVEGGRVAEGELIAAIDPFHYRIALQELSAQRQEAAARRTQLQSTLQTEWTMLRLDEGQLELARRDLVRREQLLGRAVGSEKALDDARMAVARHEAALAKDARRSTSSMPSWRSRTQRSSGWARRSSAPSAISPIPNCARRSPVWSPRSPRPRASTSGLATRSPA